VIDNGSTDNTYDLLKGVKDIKLIKIKKNIGKGDAVIHGIKAATGDIIAIQDADLEYDPADLKEMLRVMMRYGFKAVYGSRTLRRGTRAKALGILYGKKPGTYWSFYLGGQLLSFITWLFYGSFITDTVTGYKMVEAKILKSFDLKSLGFELDHEITAKILKKKHDIYEIPVSYKPRSIEEGKKIKWKDGLIAIKTLFKFRFSD
jgi:dolichol-phosphate mannosyltransferase